MPSIAGPLRLALLALVLPSCAGPPAADPGVVLDDRASLVDAEAESRIIAYLAFVRERYDLDYRVVLTRGETDLETEAAADFAEMGVGEATRGMGLLLLVDGGSQRARVEVGYALEPFLTDLQASRMIDDFLRPWFAAGRGAAGIEASIEALVDEIRPQLAAVAEAPADRDSGGAGATVELAGAAPASPEGGTSADWLERLVPQPDPRRARDLELEMMHSGRYEQRARLYDEAWRGADRPGAWSPRRLREIATDWDRPYAIESDGDHAVAYYPGDAERHLGPTFLSRSAEGWILDATATAATIVYDYSNESWVAIDGSGPYLELLQRALDLVPVRLRDGRRAWTMAASVAAK